MATIASLRRALGLCAVALSVLGTFALVLLLSSAAQAGQTVTLSNTCTTPVSGTLSSASDDNDDILVFSWLPGAKVTIVVTRSGSPTTDYLFKIDDANSSGTWSYAFSPSGSFNTDVTVGAGGLTVVNTNTSASGSGSKQWKLTNGNTSDGRVLNWTASCQLENKSLTINSVSASPTEYSASGELITFTYSITNNSPFTAHPSSALTINGTRAVTGGTCGTFSLAAAATGSCTRTYTTVPGDVPNDIVYTLSSATTAASGWTVGLAAPAPTTTVAFVAGPPDAGNSTVDATSPHVADGVDDSTVTIVLKDAGNNPVTGLTDGDFVIGLTGSAVDGTVTETGTPGTYTLSVTNTVAEVVTVSVTADGVAITDTASITFTSGDVSAGNSTVDATSPHVADGVDDSTVTIVLKDAGNNPVTGLTDGDFVIGLTGSAVDGTVTETGTPGTYTLSVTNTVAEVVTVSVTADGVAITDTASITFTSGDVSAGNSTVDATSPHVADGVDDSTVTIVLKDAGNNPVTGLTDGDFVIGLTGSAVDGTVTETGTPGTYTLSVTNTVAEVVTVSVTADGVAITDTASITFTSGDVSAGNSTVDATSPHVADGVDDSTVTIVLKDANNNPVTGLTDGDFVIGLTGSAVDGTVTETGTPGTYTLSVTNTVAEVVTVSVTADGVAITDTASITFTSGDVSAGNSTVDATSPHVADGVDNSTVTIVLKDANNNPVTGLTDGDFVIGLTGSAVDGTVTETGTPGTYTLSVTNTVAEVVTVSVTADGVAITDTASITFTSGDVSAGNSTVDATSPHVADGVDNSTVTIVLKDAGNNPVTGLTDGDFVIGLTGSAVDGTVTETGTPGTYTLSVTNTVAEVVTVSVTADGVAITDTASITFTSGDVSAGNSTVDATSPHVADGVDNSTVTIVLKDAGNNPVTGLTDGDFVIGLTGSAVDGTVTETGTPGTYTLSVTNTVAEVVTVSVTADGVAITDTASITFTSGDVSAGNSTVDATSPHVADGVDNSTVTIVLKDAGNNPVTGLTDGDFVIGLTGSAVDGTVTETGTPGTYTLSVTNTVAEVVTVSVTADGVAITDTASITFEIGTVSAGNSSVSATTPHAADGVDASTVTIVLKDAGNNPVTGLTNADFTIGLTGSAVAGTVSETGMPGTYEVSVTNTVAETVTVTVTADGTTLSQTPSIVFNAGQLSAGNSTVVATSPHIADTVDASTVTIVLVDGQGNPVSGLTNADFLIALSGSAIAGTVSETATPGTYEVLVTDGTAETVTVTVTADGVTLTQTASILFESSGIDEELVRETFTNLTRAFLLRRMDRILSHEPEFYRLINRSERLGGGFAANAEALDGDLDVDFAFSLSGMRRTLAALEPEGLSDANVQLAAVTPRSAAGTFDVWAEGQFSLYNDDTADSDRDGSFGIVYAGFDYRVTESILIGVMAQIDWARETTSVLDSEVEGDGWMVGPYASIALYEGVYLDLRAAWGRSNNSAETDVFDNGTLFSGDFDTERWLVRGTLSGTFEAGNFLITPEVSVAYMQERQEDYRVSDGANTVGVDGQTLSLGRLSMKPEVAYVVTLDNGVVVPFAKPQLLWDFESDGEFELDGEVGTQDDLRGAIEVGVRAAFNSGFAGGVSVTYDGIGDEDFNAIAVKLGLSFSF